MTTNLSLKTQIRLLISELLLELSFKVAPESEEKIALAKAMKSYFNEINKNIKKM